MNRVLFSPETESSLADLHASQDLEVVGVTKKALVLLLSSMHTGDLSKLESSTDFWRELRWKAWHFVENGDPNTKAVMRSVLTEMLGTTTTALGLHCTATEPIGRVKVEQLRLAAEEAILDEILPRIGEVIAGPVKENEEAWDRIMSDL